MQTCFSGLPLQDPPYAHILHSGYGGTYSLLEHAQVLTPAIENQSHTKEEDVSLSYVHGSHDDSNTAPHNCYLCLQRLCEVEGWLLYPFHRWTFQAQRDKSLDPQKDLVLRCFVSECQFSGYLILRIKSRHFWRTPHRLRPAQTV